MTANKVETPGALCVVTAADIEFNTVAKLLAAGTSIVENGLKVLRGRYGAQQVTLLKTEIGAAGFADKLRAHLAQNRYAALIVIGLAGALDPALRTGDVVLYDRCLDGRKLEAALRDGKFEKHPPSEASSGGISCDDKDLKKRQPRRNEEHEGNSERLPSSFFLSSCSSFLRGESLFLGSYSLGQKLFEEFGKQGLRCQRGTGLLVERVVIEAPLKLALRAQTKAAAVDMETYLVLAAAAECQLPCAAVRVVLDEAASDLPDFNAGLDAAGRVQLWPTLRALARRPRATLQFVLSLRPALRNITRAAAAVFKVFNSR